MEITLRWQIIGTVIVLKLVLCIAPCVALSVCQVYFDYIIVKIIPPDHKMSQPVFLTYICYERQS